MAPPLYRDSYWPNGILAETPPRRDKNIRMRTRVAAKTSLLGIMPGENTQMMFFGFTCKKTSKLVGLVPLLVSPSTAMVNKISENVVHTIYFITKE